METKLSVNNPLGQILFGHTGEKQLPYTIAVHVDKAGWSVASLSLQHACPPRRFRFVHG